MLLSYGANPNIRVYGEMGTNATLRPPLAELLISNDNVLLEEVKLLLKHGARVIMKTQFRDPDGLLNCLSNLTGDSPVFLYLLESAEEFDPCMIRRNPHLNLRQRSLLLEKSSAPLSLQSLTRIFFRKLFGRELPEKVPSLEVSQMLQKYLCYETYWLIMQTTFFSFSFLMSKTFNELMRLETFIFYFGNFSLTKSLVK